jgi:hypothetical protein
MHVSNVRAADRRGRKAHEDALQGVGQTASKRKELESHRKNAAD